MSALDVIKRSLLCQLLMIVTFLTSSVILNGVQIFLFYFIRPLSKYVFRKINYYVCYSLYSQLVFMAEWWSGSDVLAYVDKDEFKKYFGKEHAYLIMNHTYDIDWLIGWIFCERVGVLGNCKAYAKKSIQYVPTMGWAWKFSESVFLERNYEKDKIMIGKQVKELAEYPDPMFLLLFAEGTRFTEEKHKASVNFAKEKGLIPLKRHLTPRTKGFIASLPELRGKVPAVYDVQIGFKQSDEVEPTVMNLLLGKAVEGHLAFNRIPVESIPEDEEKASEWLRQLYERKDRMMDSFIETGDFYAKSGVPRVEPIRVGRRSYSLVNMALWTLLNVSTIVYGLTLLVSSGSYFLLAAGFTFILICGYLMQKLIAMTEISKGSSYGKSTPSTPEKEVTNGSSVRPQ